MSQTKKNPSDRPGQRRTDNAAKQNHTRSADHKKKHAFSKAYYQRRKKQRIRRIKKWLVLGGCAAVVIGILYLAVVGLLSLVHGKEPAAKSATAAKVSFEGDIEKMSVDAPEMEVKLLTVNKYSRPGTKLKKVRGIVVHYVGNPGTTAAQNRSYFESLKDTHETSASSHFLIGMEGEIIQCIPTSEIAYTSNNRNEDTVSIECCHPKKDGRFTDETYDSLVHLAAFLCCKYDLDIEDIIRHYDVTGKECPKYYVKHEDEWVQLKKDVAAYIKKYGKKS